MGSLRNHLIIKRIVLIAILVAMGVILSLFDKFISSLAFPFLPTAKIGLANVVILLGIYRFSFKETLLMTVMKSALVGLILGSPITFIISFVASLISFLGMYVAYRTLKKWASMISVSVIGGFLHIVGQLATVSIIYQLGDVVLAYGALLVFVSLVTSTIIGFVSLRVVGILDLKNS
ncbi:MAG: Gx transporter family protein [Bacilli bacterium]